MITRALGSDPRLQPDLYEINVETGDRLLLCSDGLSSMVHDRDIEAIMTRVRDPQRCASQLVSAAIAAGGHDNVTVIVANVEGFAEARRKKMARKTKLTIALVLVLLAAIVGGAAYAFSYWTGNAAYLAELDGKVAVYRGVPGSFLGMTFSQLECETDVSVDDLQPGLANRLREGAITADSVEAAQALVDSYRQDIAQQNGEAGTGDAAGEDGAAGSGNAAGAGADGNSGSADATGAANSGNSGNATAAPDDASASAQGGAPA